MSPRLAAALAATLVLSVLPGLAADCDPWTDMHKPGFAPIAATIDTPYPIGLLNDCAVDGSCPARDALETGDRIVITSDIDQRQACAVRIGPAPDYRVESGHVIMNIVEPDNQRTNDWLGAWQAGTEQFITIEQAEDILDVTGEATWGMSDPERVASGGINLGNFSASARPKRGNMAFTIGDDEAILPFDAAADSCSVRLWLAGEYLVAVDNNACGGMNVTFTGFYTRKGSD